MSQSIKDRVDLGVLGNLYMHILCSLLEAELCSIYFTASWSNKGRIQDNFIELSEIYCLKYLAIQMVHAWKFKIKLRQCNWCTNFQKFPTRWKEGFKLKYQLKFQTVLMLKILRSPGVSYLLRWELKLHRVHQQGLP